MIQLTNTFQPRVKAILLLLFLGICNYGNSQTYFSKILQGWENYNFVETDSSYISFGMNNKVSPYKNFIQISEIKKNDTSISYDSLIYDTNINTETGFSNSSSIKLNSSVYVVGDIANGYLKGVVYKLYSNNDSFSILFQDTSTFRTRFFTVKNNDGNLLVTGVTGPSGQKTLTTLMIIDTLGNLKLSKTYSVPFQNIHLYPKDIVSTSDDGFLLLCQEEEPEYQVIGRPIKLYRSTIIKTDSLGNEEWRKRIGDSRFNNKGTNIVKASYDSTYFLCWEEADSILVNWYPWRGQWETKRNPESPMKLSKIKENGNEVWTKTYETFFPKFSNLSASPLLAKEMIKTKDNHIVVGGIAYGSALLKVTEEGDYVWNRYHIEIEDSIPFPDSYTALNTIKETKDGGFIIGGVYELNIAPNSRNGFAIKLDKYGCQYPDCHKEDKWYLDSVAYVEDSLANEANKSNKGGTILLYPNPTNGLLTIKLPASLELSNSVEVFIYTAQGKLMQTSSLTDYTTQFSTSNLPKGMYLLQFKGSGMEEENYKVVVY